MANEVVMPQMGADMTEGTLLKWLKSEGDQVKRGEIIAEIETDKANVEIEAFASGTLQNVTAHEGDVIQVGDVMALIAGEGEKLAAPAAKQKQAAGSNGASAAGTRPDVTPEGEVRKEEAAVGRGEAGEEAILEQEESEERADRGEDSPALREDRARESGKPAAAAPPEPSARVKASPIARRMARESGVDLAALQGSGPEGRIVRRDVEAAMAKGPAGEPGPRPMVAPEPEPQAETKPVEQPRPAVAGQAIETTRMRAAIARRMSQSKQQAPHFYVTVDVDMTELLEQRSRLNASLDDASKVSVNDLIVKASAAALKRYPHFNAHYRNDQLVVFPEIHICIGVALPDGLIAPSIRNCETKSLVEIARASKDVVARAREGRLYPQEFDGSFTITNLGAYGVETLIGIINPPQVAILGVGMAQAKPVVKDGQVVVAQLMKLALSADHRAVDGANGGEFLAYLKQALENPLLLA
ncbi:MAG: dihydrolipoamide acetyltransferase family protein [Dehalococcoidia bacterium]